MFSDHLPDTCVSFQRRSNGTSVSKVVADPPFFNIKCRLLIFDTARCILNTEVFIFWWSYFFVLFLVLAFLSPINCRQSQQQKRQNKQCRERRILE